MLLKHSTVVYQMIQQNEQKIMDIWQTDYY